MAINMKKTTLIKIIISLAACFTTVTITLLVVMLFKSCNYTLPKNTYYLNYDLSNMKKCDVTALVDDDINTVFEKAEIDVVFDDNYFKIYGKNYNFRIDADELFNLAKNSNAKEEDLINVTPELKFSKNKLIEDLENFKQKSREDPIKFSYKKTKKNEIAIYSGTTGKEIDVEKTAEKIINTFKDMSFKNVEADETILTDEESRIDLEKISDDIYCEVKDASYSISKNGIIEYAKEVIGYELNMKKATEIITNFEEGNYTVPITIVKPKETVASLKTKHDNAATPDVLATFTTKYDKTDANRNFNIQKAALSIHNIVLYPGEGFSAIRTISPGNKLIGYKEAKVFTEHGIGKGPGGGICQVTSTLYNAAVLAYMNIKERHPHSMLVNYVNPGRDAAYDSGGVDLKIINSRKDPIRIVASFTENSLTFAIKGTKRADENFEVAMASEVTGQTANRINAVNHITVKKDGKIIDTKNVPSSYKILKNKN